MSHTVTHATRAAALLAITLGAAAPQEPAPVQRILEQDPALNNLVDPRDYATSPPGTLGEVIRGGDPEASSAMILVPGHGFGAAVFDDLLDGWAQSRRTYAVTLAGFGGTQAPPAPPEGTSFGEQTWTRGAIDAIDTLMDEESIDDVVLVGHWLGGTQVVLDLARRHPGQVRAVVLLAGSPRWVTPSPGPADEATPQQRVANVDQGLAPRWFKTVTRDTWDDNNFLPGDYAANPVIGLRLWRQAATPPLHVWVRYLCEFFAQDATLLLDELAAPILLVQPGLEGLWHEPGNNYMAAYAIRSWGASLRGRGNAEVVALPGTRAVPWADNPGAVRATVDAFLARQE